jgi:hypothetical protein
MLPPGAVIPGAVGPSSTWSPTEAYSFAWNLVTKRFGTVAAPIVVGYLAQIAIVFVVYGAMVFVPQLLIQQGVVDTSVGLILTYASMSVAVVIYLFIVSFFLGGFVQTALKAVRGQPTSVGDVFQGGRFMLPCLVALIVFEIAIGIGFALCVVPGVILGLGLCMWPMLVIDKGMSGVDALKRSWEMTKGQRVNLFVFALLGIVVYVAGELACVLPVFLISMPMILMAWAWTYLRLTGESVVNPT